MERKTSQKILLRNYCYVSYIWFQEMIFDVFRDLRTAWYVDHSRSHLVLIWSGPWVVSYIRGYIYNRIENLKSAVLGLTLQTYGHSENCGIGKIDHSVPAS